MSSQQQQQKPKTQNQSKSHKAKHKISVHINPPSNGGAEAKTPGDRRVKELGKELKGLDDSAKHKPKEVQERVARLVGGGGDSRGGKRRRRRGDSVWVGLWSGDWVVFGLAFGWRWGWNWGCVWVVKRSRGVLTVGLGFARRGFAAMGLGFARCGSFFFLFFVFW